MLALITETSASVMFISLVLRTGSLILILFDLTFPIQCTEYDEKCYMVGNRDVCFFRPQFNYTWVTWDKATETCRRRNGTLPFIPDKAIQHVFEEYMNSLKRRYTDDMWMAGREMRRKDWTWVNGMTFNEPTYFAKTDSDYNSYHLQAILADEGVYRKEFLGNRNNYVCQFFGEACQSRDAISLKHGCVILNDGETLDLYDARNKCVEKGIDLAVIDGQDDMNKFQQVFSRIRKAAKIWVGLRRQWWMWNATGAEMRYSNWLLDNGFKPDNRECMVTELQDYLWKQESCNSYKRFICQTGPTYVGASTTPLTPLGGLERSNGLLFLVAGISSLVLTILLVVIIVVVIVKRRKTRLRQTRMEVVPTDTSYQQLQRTLYGQSKSKSDQKYTELQPSTKKPPLPTTDRPVQSEQTEGNADYLYDDIAEIRAPSYLEPLP